MGYSVDNIRYSIKILMLADAGYEPQPQDKSYLKMILFLKKIIEFPNMNWDIEAKELLKDIGEL